MWNRHVTYKKPMFSCDILHLNKFNNIHLDSFDFSAKINNIPEIWMYNSLYKIRSRHWKQFFFICRIVSSIFVKWIVQFCLCNLMKIAAWQKFHRSGLDKVKQQVEIEKNNNVSNWLRRLQLNYEYKRWTKKESEMNVRSRDSFDKLLKRI